MNRNRHLYPALFMAILAVFTGWSASGVLAQPAEPSEVVVTALGSVQTALTTLKTDAEGLVYEDPTLGPIVNSMLAPAIESAQNAVDRLAMTVLESPVEDLMNLADFFTYEAPLPDIISGYQSIDRASVSSTFATATGSEVIDAAGKGFEAAGTFLGDTSASASALKAVGKVLRMLGQIGKGLASETGELEGKLDNIGDRFGKVLTGESIPVRPGTTYTPPDQSLIGRLQETKVALQEIRQKVDNLGERAGETLTGEGIPIEPGTTYTPPEKPIMEILGELKSAQENIDDLLGKVVSEPPSFFFVEIPGQEPGTVAGETVQALQSALLTVRADVQEAVEEDASLASVAEFVVIPAIDAGDTALGTLTAMISEMSLETLTVLDNFFTREAPLSTITSGYRTMDRESVSAKSAAQTGGEVVTAAGKAVMAVGDITSLGPVKGIGRLIKMVGQLVKQFSGAGHQLEKKMDNMGERLGKVLTGEPIPVKPGTTYTPPEQSITDLLDEVKKKLDNLSERAGQTLTGQGIPVEPGTEFSPPEKTISDLLDEIKKKLDNLGERAGRVLTGTEIPVEPGTEMPPTGYPPLAKDLWTLKQKIDNLAGFVGRVLIGHKYNPEPMTTTPVPYPEKPIKEELHELEADIDIIINNYNWWWIWWWESWWWNWWWNWDWDTYIFNMVKQVKHIYVYEQDTFVPTSNSPTRSIMVKTPAFALSGWIDLTEMEAGDRVDVDIFVSIDDGNSFKPWSHTEFSDQQKRGLKFFSEFSDGIEEMPGNLARIDITQVASSTDFGNLISIPYQFIVESALGDDRRPIPRGQARVIVTDDIRSFVDLSGGQDFDDADERELVIRWKLGETDVRDYHVHVEVDGQSRQYLGRTGNALTTYIRWRKGASNLSSALSEGPEFGHKYRFFIYVITKSGSPRVLRPVSNRGPVEFLEQQP